MSDSADLLQAFLRTAEDAVFVIEAATGIVVEASLKAIHETGYPLEELRGLGIDHLLHQKDRSPLPCFSADSGKATAIDCQCLQLLKKNGESLPVSISTVRFEWRMASHIILIASKTQEVASCINARNTSLPEREDFPTIIGRSVKIRDVCRRIGSLAKSDVTVLIQGESGTGKEIIANAVHAHSLRGRAPFVKVNCAALTETLLESELFGHVKGAFTGAIRDRLGRFKQADKGTIFLDEIGSMSLAGQAKLLRVLQEHEFEPVGSSVTTPVNVRVIAATNSDLTKAVTEGRFREDLYYRLNVFPIYLPSLRERKEDIALLAQHFLCIHNRASAKQISAIAPDTLHLLVEHDWPGNVRELDNAIEHAVIVEAGLAISPDSLPMNLSKPHKLNGSSSLSIEPGLRDKLNALEKQILIDTLVRANGVKKQAAAMLGIDARNMPYLLRKHHLDECANPDANLH
jgi:two-component system, NtrC family, response regulator AtoC